MSIAKSNGKQRFPAAIKISELKKGQRGFYGEEMKANAIGFVGGMEHSTDVALATGKGTLFGSGNRWEVLTGIEANAEKNQA